MFLCILMFSYDIDDIHFIFFLYWYFKTTILNTFNLSKCNYVLFNLKNIGIFIYLFRAFFSITLRLILVFIFRCFSIVVCWFKLISFALCNLHLCTLRGVSNPTSLLIIELYPLRGLVLNFQ